MRIPYSKGIEIYGNSSLLIQSVLGFFLAPIPRSVMLGSGFHIKLQELYKTQWYNPQKLEKYQENRLRALIKHAYQKVPYYNRMFKERKIGPDDIKTIKDLRKLPILTKDDLRNHFSEFIAINAGNYKFGIGHTSGSTGKPTSFYLDQQNREMEYALKWRQRAWANIGLNGKIATFRPFRGLRGVNFHSGNPPWRFNPLSKEFEFNIFGINNATLEKHVQKLKNL